MISYDICILGGGPSGSAIAKRLAEFGYSVVIIEKVALPRRQLGLSLSPGVWHWLDILGIRKEIERQHFIPAASSVLLWEDETPVIKEDSGDCHADRGAFDHILLQAALAAGVDLIQPCKGLSVAEDASGKWSITASGICFTAAFIVEATGRRPFFKGAKKSYMPSLLAVTAYWNVQGGATSFIEAGRNHWCWAAPAANELAATVFADPALLKSYDSVTAFYLAMMRDFSLLQPRLQNSHFSDLSVCAATPCVDEKPVQRNYIKVGDAAFSTDPLSAQGVQKALKTAVQGAAVVNTILAQPEAAGLAMSFYQEMISTEVSKNTQWTKYFYGAQHRYTGGEFWEKRRSSPTAAMVEKTISVGKTSRLLINPACTVTGVPVIEGSLIKTGLGVSIAGHDEPFVFVSGFSIATLMAALQSQEAGQCLNIIRALMPAERPMQVLQWLLYNRLLVTAPELVSSPEPARALDATTGITI